jgi:hypothetical protein
LTIYKYDRLDINLNNKNIVGSLWYQHHIERNTMFHFLSGMTKKTFQQIKGFSYDFSYLYCYDDDDFLLRVKSCKIDICCIDHNISHVYGIHLHHKTSPGLNFKPGYINSSNVSYYDTAYISRELFNKKLEYYQKYDEYLDISSGETVDQRIKIYNKLYQK